MRIHEIRGCEDLQSVRGIDAQRVEGTDATALRVALSFVWPPRLQEATGETDHGCHVVCRFFVCLARVSREERHPDSGVAGEHEEGPRADTSLREGMVQVTNSCLIGHCC